MKVISCLGRKGGSGKTMIAHLLAHGLSKGYGVFANLVMTDVREASPINFSDGREYYISAIKNRNVKEDAVALEKIFEQTAKIPDSILIIDGGANRAAVDASFARYSDMILIPAGTGVEDLEVAENDYWNLKEVIDGHEQQTDIFIIRNRWPGAKQRQDLISRKPWINRFLQRTQSAGMLFPDFVPDMPSLLDMANANDPKTTPLIDAVATRFAEITAKRLGQELPERRKLVPYPHRASAQSDDMDMDSAMQDELRRTGS